MLVFLTLQYLCAWCLEKGKQNCLRRLNEGILNPGSSMTVTVHGKDQSVAVGLMELWVMFNSAHASGYELVAFFSDCTEILIAQLSLLSRLVSPGSFLE